MGHNADKCYKVHGYPPGYKPKGKLLANQVSTNVTFGNTVSTNGCFGNFSSQATPPNLTCMMSYSPQFSGPHSQFSGAQPHFNGSQPHLSMPQPQFGVPQCPISQSQCEHLLYFLTSQSCKDTSGGHQAATIMSPLNAFGSIS